ncbi:MAG: hypothetical protein HYY16_02135 [Planctomycetes bacterium]|nr:hypothetical protein [Planctomycetota bacterium]
MTDRYCVNCGDPYQGKGDLCPDCTPITQSETEPLPPAKQAGNHAPPSPRLVHPRCPHCSDDLAWEDICRYSRRPTPGQIEVLYYCPSCRSALEFAAWIEVPPRRPTHSERRHRPQS